MWKTELIAMPCYKFIVRKCPMNSSYGALSPPILLIWTHLVLDYYLYQTVNAERLLVRMAADERKLAEFFNSFIQVQSELVKLIRRTKLKIYVEVSCPLKNNLFRNMIWT